MGILFRVILGLMTTTSTGIPTLSLQVEKTHKQTNKRKDNQTKDKYLTAAVHFCILRSLLCWFLWWPQTHRYFKAIYILRDCFYPYFCNTYFSVFLPSTF